MSESPTAKVDLLRDREALKKLVRQVHAGRNVTHVEIKAEPGDQLEALQELPSLVALWLVEGHLPDDLVLTNVHGYIGPAGVALEHWPSLVEVSIGGVSAERFELRLAGPVETLHVGDSAGTIAVDRLAMPEKLISFSAAFSNRVDVAGLRDCRNLERVLFEHVSHVSSVDAFKHARSLYWIGFTDVADVTPIDGLVGVRASGGAGVGHRHPFPPSVRLRMREAEPKWSFPTDEKFFVEPVQSEAGGVDTAPFESAGDLAMELEGAVDVRRLLLDVFAQATTHSDDGFHAERAMAAGRWLASALPHGSVVLDGPDRDIPEMDESLRRAAREALLAVARADAADGRDSEAARTRSLVDSLAETGES